MGSIGRRHLISLRDVSHGELDAIVGRAVHFAAGPTLERPLCDRIVGIYFGLTSTRTRTAFTTAALRLGAHTIAYGPGDLQLNTGESMRDTGNVLARMLDALVVRIPGGPQDLLSLAAQDRMSVVNAMSLDEHPTQALCDLTTMRRSLGGIDGLRILYVGEGNSTAAALCFALAGYRDVELHVRSPPGYGLAKAASSAARGSDTGTRVEERHDMLELPDHVDVIYTTRWQTTGTDKPDADWREIFAPFRVDTELLARYPRAVFMHDLPAHRGDEVEAAVIDGPRSIVLDQAAHKLFSAMAVLEWCVAADEQVRA